MSNASSISRVPVVIERRTAGAGGIAVIAFNHVDGPNTLKGFADLHVPAWRLRILGCPAHANINGSRWVGLPGKPMTDKAGVPLRDATTGKARYVQLLAFDRRRDAAPVQRRCRRGARPLCARLERAMSGDLSFDELERLVWSSARHLQVTARMLGRPKSLGESPRPVFRTGIRIRMFAGYDAPAVVARARPPRLAAGGGYSRQVVMRQSAAPMKPDPEPAERTRRALAIWNEAEPIAFAGGAIASRYLVRRGVDLSALPNEMEHVLRWHPRCPWGPGNTAPCMLALWTDTITGDA